MNPDTNEATSTVGNELLLARALDAAFESRREDLDGRVEEVALTPALRAELESLVRLAGLLRDTTSSARPSDEFRRSARDRILAHARTTTAVPHTVAASQPPLHLVGQASPAAEGPRIVQFRLRRAAPWLGRIAAGFFAVVLVGGTTFTASADALPGDPLYGVKEAAEALTLRLASDDGARARIYLSQADTRLNEIARLLDLGREADAARVLGRYETALRGAEEHAASGEPVLSAQHIADGTGANALDDQIARHEARIAELIEGAPEPARAALEAALLTPNHGRERSLAVRQAISEGERPGPSDQASFEQDVPSVGGGAATAVATARALERTDSGRSSERPVVRPPDDGTVASEATRGPRDEVQVEPARPIEREEERDGGGSPETERLRPPVLRTPTERREDTRPGRATPRETSEESRARSGPGGAR